MGEQPAYTIQSVARAIAILKSFNLEQPERGVSELSRELGLHPSTVSRLMSTLEQGGLITRQPETQRYRLGIDLIGLAEQVIDYLDIREVARPILREYAEVCQETVFLSILDAGLVTNIEYRAPAGREVGHIGRLGRWMPAHCTAAGRVLLAHLPTDALNEHLPAVLEPLTTHTITDPFHLRKVLADVRRQGFAVSEEELEVGLNAVAAPIYDHARHVRAALGIAGPAYRVTPVMFPVLTEQLKVRAGEISMQLGYRPD